MTIGERIKERRIELGLTQMELSQKMGYKNKSAICNVEKRGDNITSDRIEKLAAALECTPGYLMGWEDSEYKLDLIAMGKRIQDLRIKNKMTLVEFESKSNIDKTYLSSVEHGLRNISIANLIHIANALNCSVEYLVNGTISTFLNNDNESVLNDEEKYIINAYRSADNLTKAMVLRTLGIDSKRDVVQELEEPDLDLDDYER